MVHDLAMQFSDFSLEGLARLEAKLLADVEVVRRMRVLLEEHQAVWAQGVPAGVELDLASKIGSQLKALAETNKGTKIVVVDQTKVNAFKTNDPNRWNTGNPGEFARQLGADFWIDVNVVTFKLMDRDFGGEICRGSANLEVSVYEAGKAEPKYSYPLPHQAQLKPTDVSQLNLYRNQYIGQLATEVAFQHVNYKGEQKRAQDKGL